MGGKCYHTMKTYSFWGFKKNQATKTTTIINIDAENKEEVVDYCEKNGIMICSKISEK